MLYYMTIDYIVQYFLLSDKNVFHIHLVNESATSKDEKRNNKAVQAVNGIIRADLMATRDKMVTLYLPPVREGRYRFPERAGQAMDLPFDIVAENDRWLLRTSSKKVTLHRGEEKIGSPVILQEDDLIGLSFGGEHYVLFTQPVQEKDHVFVPYRIPQDGTFSIGREADNDICYENSYVSRKHATFRIDRGNITVADENSTNGTYVNGFAVQEAALNAGDSVYIMGLNLLVGKGFIALNNANNRCQVVNAAMISAYGEDEAPAFAQMPEEMPEETLFDRQPRRKLEMEPQPIEVYGPPTALNGNQMPLMVQMSSQMVTGARSLVTGNALMAFSSMLTPLLNRGFTDKERMEYAERRHVKYMQYLAEVEKEILNERSHEQAFLNEAHPPLSTVIEYPADKKRLWEYRPVDKDYLQLRIGTGKVPLQAEISWPREQFNLDEDALREEMLRVAKRDYSITNAPVLLSLKDDFVVGVNGTRAHVEKLMANMIIQLAMTHSYDEVKIVILGRPQDTTHIAEEMRLFRYLPHCWSNLRDIRFIAENKADAGVIAEYLKKQQEDQGGEAAKKKAQWTSETMSYVIFAFDKQLLECLDILGVVLSAESYPGYSVVTGYNGALKESRKLISMERNNGMLIHLSGSEGKDTAFALERCDRDALVRHLHTVCGTKIKTEGRQFSLPKVYSFLEMFNAGRIEYLNPLVRWQQNNPVKSLATPVGIGTDGELFYLDLHEKRQGPHGLVAGMTGSGKSEFIITYILSMAVNYGPNEVAFVLIDYKGGGLATAFDDPKRGIHLPHIAGTITNLDGGAIQRSLSSIQSELKRRQAVFNDAKSRNNEATMDIYDYQKLYRAHKVDEPMPHLFIISDEFAELKKQQPDFMEALIQTARIGRSLGVHLILATQKPSGVVNDQIWSNTKFRVCLKVQDRSDSNEMIKRPEAAELKETGRFYLQVGYNEYFALGQSAWCGAKYTPQDVIVSNVDETIDFVDNAGQVTLNSKPARKTETTDTRQLVAIVQYLSDLAKKENMQTRPLWLEPLPEKLDLEVPKAMLPEEREEAGIRALIGVADDPEEQQQHALEIDFLSLRHMILCGEAGSGKSTFLRTMLYSLAEQYGPDQLNYYILDLSGGAMSPMKELPHCGAYLSDRDESDLDRLMDMLRDIIEERKALFAAEDVVNYNTYIKIKPLPLILFIIDSYTNIVNFAQGPTFNTELQFFLREAASYGVSLIASMNHYGEMYSKARMEIDYTIALWAKDRYDYSDILGTRTMLTAPQIQGRGVCVLNGRTMEYQTAIPDADLDDVERTGALHERLRKLSEKYEGMPHAPGLPEIDETMAYGDFCKGFKPMRIPLGFNRKTAAKVAIPFAQFSHMSLYFGNPAEVTPVLGNLLYAAKRENMRLMIIRSQQESSFYTTEITDRGGYTPEEITWLDCTEESLSTFPDLIKEEIMKQIVPRDEYCAKLGLPDDYKGKAKKASKYIRQHSQPVLILIENYGDLSVMNTESGIESAVMQLVNNLDGYNIYCAGCFHGADFDRIGTNSEIRNFAKEQFLLLFGGAFHKQALTSLPSEYRMDGISSRIGRFVMKYRDAFYPMTMPCGGYTAGDNDPDEAAIV